MKKISNILAATDLSNASLMAMQRAASLANLHKSHLELLNVVESSLLEQFLALLGPATQTPRVDIIDDARKTLRKMAADLHDRFGVAASVKIHTGKVLKCLSDSADALSADLIVAGARGESIAKDILIGSTAENLLQKTKHPTLVVKREPREQYQRVLVPVDFSPASLAALTLARRVAPGAELVVLNAFSVPYEGKLRMALVDNETIAHYRDMALNESLFNLREFTTSAGLGPDDCRILAVSGDAWISILDQEKLLQCDLVAIGKHGSNLLEDFLLGSVTKMVLGHASSDVLVAL